MIPLPQNVIHAFLSSHWAMTPDAIQKCYQIITRQVGDLEAVSRELGRPLNNTRETKVREGVAYLPIRGPMIRYGDSFKAISGATSYEALARDLEVARRDASVRAIVLDLDSPGGELNGCLEFGELVRRADDSKPVYALATGSCASAAYLIAAAARRIVGVPSAIFGSLGVCMTVIDDSKRDEEMGIAKIDVVSSSTPHKNEDPNTEEGFAAIQQLVDDLAAVYAAPIARYRNHDPATLLKDYGAGAVFVASSALAQGLADQVSYAEDFHASLVAELDGSSGPTARATSTTASAPPKASHQQEPKMKIKKGQKVRAKAGAAAGVKVGAEGTVEDVKEGKSLVAFAGGKKVWVTNARLDITKPAANAAAASEGEDDEEAAAEGDDAEDGEDDEEGAAAEGEDAEDGEDEEQGDEGGKPAATAKDPVAAERQRILGIQALGLPGEEKVIQACVDDPKCTVEMAALKLRQAQAGKPGKRMEARARADEGMPRAGAPAPTNGKKVSPQGERVLAAIGRRFGTTKKDPRSTQA